jgi:transposase InsO family protein
LCRWHIDQTGNIGECAFTGFKTIIAFVCETTGFAWLFGSRFGSGLEVAIAFITVISFFGLPESFHTDGGSENDNYIWHQLQQITGLKHSFGIPNVPRTRGIIERNIGTAKKFLRLLCVDIGKHSSWGLLLPIAQKGMNDLKRQDLGWISPYQLVFGFRTVVATPRRRNRAAPRRDFDSRQDLFSKCLFFIEK